MKNLNSNYSAYQDYRQAMPPFSVHSYKVNDGVSDSNSLPIYFSVTPVNDPPVLNGENNPRFNDCTTEDSEDPCLFKIPIGSDVDLDDNLTYHFKNLPNDGVLSGCAGLPGADGPSDISCVYTPNPNTSGDVELLPMSVFFYFGFGSSPHVGWPSLVLSFLSG